MITRFSLLLVTLSVPFCLMAAPFKSWQADQAYNEAKNTNGDFTTALRLYEDVVAANPHDLEALYNVGKSAYQLKDYGAAQVAFDKVAHSSAASSKQKEQAFFNQGDAYAMDKQYHKALSSYESVLKIRDVTEAAKLKTKERIEKIKKLLEQQKQQEQNDQKENQQNKENESQNQQQDEKQGSSQKNDSKQKNESSQSKPDQSSSKGDSSSEQSSKDKQDNRKEQSNNSSTERSPEGKQDHSKNTEQHNKNKDQGQQSQGTQENKEPKNQHEAGKQERSQSQGTTDADKRKQQEQKDTQKHSTDKGEHHDSSPPSDAEQKSFEYSIPEKQLSDQEKRNLQIIEEADKEAYRVFFKGRVKGGEADGQKNW